MDTWGACKSGEGFPEEVSEHPQDGVWWEEGRGLFPQ